MSQVLAAADDRSLTIVVVSSLKDVAGLLRRRVKRLLLAPPFVDFLQKFDYYQCILPYLFIAKRVDCPWMAKYNVNKSRLQTKNF